jgi:hypothetical protein
MRHLKPIILAITCLASGTVCAADDTVWKQAISIPDYFGSTDSAGFSTYRFRTAYYPLYEHGDKYTGVEYLHNQFTQGNWGSSANQLTLVSKAINPRTALGYNLNLGYNVENRYTLLTTDSEYGLRLTDSTTGEIVVNRDRVETQNSLINGVYYTLAGASIEQQLIDRLTLVGIGGGMFFSDTNRRAYIRFKLIYDLIPESGITAQLRYRQYHDSNTSVANLYYFNPGEYTETMLVLGVKRRLSGWTLSGAAGLGQQRIDQEPGTSSQLAEFAVTSPYAGKIFFRARLGYSNSAEFFGPNYSYRYIMEDMIISL